MESNTTQLQNELVPHLVNLFSLAGLVSEADQKAYHRKTRKYKPIVEVLKQEAFSLETFSDLFFKAELNPFKASKSTSKFEDQLVGATTPRPDELLAMLLIHKPPLEEMIRSLELTGASPAGALRDGIEQAKSTKAEPYEWLVENEILTPGTLRKFLAAPSNPLPRACALFMAISILEHNSLIPAATHQKLVKKISPSEPAPAIGEIQKEIKLTSAHLLEKIESGLFIHQVSLAEKEASSFRTDLFPESFIRRRIFLPLTLSDQRIDLAVGDPLDLGLATLMRWFTGRWMLPHFAPSSVLIDKIQECFGSADDSVQIENGGMVKAGFIPPPAAAPPEVASAKKGAKPSSKKKGEETPAQLPAKAHPASAGDLKAPAKVEVLAKRTDAPVDSLSAVQLVSSIVESAIDLRATDIHLEPSRTQMTVRFRIDGVLTKILSIPANLVGPVASRIKVLANMDVTERRRPQDGHIALNMADRHFDFRIGTLPALYGEKIAIRILDSARVLTGFSELNMTPGQLKAAYRLIHQPYGIILVTGPTGSGKTSTLYAALNELNTENRHLVTIEDPIEYQLDGINQVQVDPNIGLTFSEGLRAILRQDPNVIMVGEIRDPDTALTAVRAAMTGHLVFSTLHTNTAIGAFQALANLGVTSYMIGSAITGVISQRLVRKLCTECAKAKPVPAATAQQLGLKSASGLKWKYPVGCPACLGTGYSGRTGIFEIIEMTERFRRAVLDTESPSKLLEIANKDGRVSIREAGLEKVRKGITSPEEIIQKVILES